MRQLAERSLLFSIVVVVAACGGDDNPGTPDVDAAPTVDAAADPDAEVVLTPAIASVDYPVIAHGGRLIISGSNLEGTTEVSIGGIVHTDLVDVGSDAITVVAVDETVPVGLVQPVTTTSPLGTSEAFDVTVIHLVISEIDPDTPGADTAEFIEVDTGLAEVVSLDGYVVALFQGNSVLGDTLAALDLNADTAATGLLVVGPATLGVTPQVIFDGPIQAGEDGAALYQFADDVAGFPASFDLAGETGLIDGIIWESNADDDEPSIATLVSDNVVIDEGATSPEREAVSIQRCLDTNRRTGASYGLATPTPGAANPTCATRQPR